MKLGKNIKIIREVRCLSRDYMATSLNVSLSTYGKIERDEREVNTERLNCLAEILDVTPDCIINICDEILQKSNEISIENQYEQTYSKPGKQEDSLISTLVNQVDKLINQNNQLVSIIKNNGT